MDIEKRGLITAILVNAQFHYTKMGESLSVYAIINAIIFGIVFVEILFQMFCSLFNRQKIKRKGMYG